MRPILLDTNAYAAFRQGEKNLLEIIQVFERIVLSPIVLGELLSGFEGGNRAKKNREELHEFLSSFRVKIYPLTADTANFYSQVYSTLKIRGKPIPSNDLWIAAQALEHGCVICSYDAHFKVIEGLISGTTVSELML